MVREIRNPGKLDIEPLSVEDFLREQGDRPGDPWQYAGLVWPEDESVDDFIRFYREQRGHFDYDDESK